MPVLDPSFAKRWRSRFGLSASDQTKAIKDALAERPFTAPADAVPLIRFLFEKLPKLLADADPKRLMLAEAFAWCCYAFWQCGSAFPSFPENYALFLKDALLSPKPGRAALTLAKMMLEFNAGEGRCGFNRLQLADADLIRQSETLVHEGKYEFYLRAQEKYDEYLFYLTNSEDFAAEWALLKEAFVIIRKKMIRRTLMTERNWERGPGAEFTSAPEQFQALFDFFCWKYYLWGMDGDTPLLLKTSVVFTPYGTQLFIPGYLSFDPKRDLDFSKITRLHGARGVARQGPGFSIGRRELAGLKQRAKMAAAEAAQKKLKGDRRYQFICHSIGFRDGGDYRRLRKLLQKTKSDHDSVKHQR